jgi:trk system potassium uptake protein TrkA
MHVIVVGCGRLGAELSIELDKAGHSVAVIDKNRNAFRRYLPERWSGRAVLGFGFDRDALEQADIAGADAVAAVTGGDNSNIMTARIARETYEIENVVARIQDPRRATIYQRLGIPTMASVAWATDQVMRRLNPDAHAVEWTDANGAVSMIEVSLPIAWAGQKLAPLSTGDKHRLVAISRGGTGRLATEGLIGQEGDVLHLMVQRDAIAELDALLDHGPEGGHH